MSSKAAVGTAYKEILFEVKDEVAWVTINRPEVRNAFREQTLDEMIHALSSTRNDPSIACAVVTGAGDQAFSAGGDLSGSFVDDPVGLHRSRGALADLFRTMFRGGKPTVARVNGHALAGGFGLAVACDITICVEDAKLGATEVRVGLWPMMISAVLLRSLPRKAALELMLTGRLIDPYEAQRLGAVSRVVARDGLDAAVTEVVEALKANSPATAMIGKDAFAGIGDLGLDAALDRLQTGLTATAMTEDAGEGIAAFLEKRQPRWK
jgi:enoyl-CoA hydratase/carnithine racemase